MRTALIALLAVFVCAPIVEAQTGVPTSWNLRIYQQGTATQVVPAVTVSAPAVACNQAAPATTSTENPDKWVWDDVQNVGRVCIYLDAARLGALADGSYEGAAVAANADGSGAESARAPFNRRRPNPPGAPLGVKVIR
jgi:hypothetical protein